MIAPCFIEISNPIPLRLYVAKGKNFRLLFVASWHPCFIYISNPLQVSEAEGVRWATYQTLHILGGESKPWHRRLGHLFLLKGSVHSKKNHRPRLPFLPGICLEEEPRTPYKSMQIGPRLPGPQYHEVMGYWRATEKFTCSLQSTGANT